MKKIVTFHTGCGPHLWEYPEFSKDANPEDLKSIIRDFGKVPVILAHMGCYSSRSPRIWLDAFDTSAVTYVVTQKKFVDKIRKAVEINRILFGSDYPVVRGFSIKSMVAEVKGS